MTTSGGFWRNTQANYGLFTSVGQVNGSTALTGDTVIYNESSARVSTWRDNRGTVTTFTYGPAGLLVSARTPTGVGTDSVIQRFRSADSVALAAPALPSAVYTHIYNPRFAGDTAFTKLWLGPWGNPLEVTDAAGRTTSVLPHVTFPLLAARVTTAVGTTAEYSQYALYNAHGKLTYMNADPVGGNPAPEWYYRYQDANYPDNLTSTTDPAGVTTTYTYAAVAGVPYPQLATQRLGPDAAATASFFYCTAANCLGLPSGSATPQNAQGQVATDTYEYDALGNLSATVSAGGKRTEYENDGIGRLLVTRTLLASTPSARWLTDSTVYDVLDRVTRTVRAAWGDGTPGSGYQAVTVNTRYLGATGLPVAVARSGSDGIMGTLTDSTEYDALGRITRRFAQGVTLPESLTYDPAGNVKRRVTPRGGRITTTYDVLNRPDTVITSAMTYDSLRIGTATLAAIDVTLRPPFPRVDLGRTSRLVVDGDTATFTYDFGTGQIATATNRAAQVSRTYLATGALTSETQKVRTVTGDDFTQHVYTTQYTYDVAGRRKTVGHPAQLAPGTQTETWAYDSLTGRPAAVRDPMDSTVKFFFDPIGQLIRQITPNNVSRQYLYTLDGEVSRDLLAPGNATPGPPITPIATPLAPLPRRSQYDGYVRYVDYTYDLRGKVLTAHNSMGLRDSMTFDYTPMGHLRQSKYSTYYYDYVGFRPSVDSLRTSETIRPDAMGTTTWRQTATQNFNFAGAYFNDGRYNASAEQIPTYHPNTGRLARTTSCSPTNCVPVAKDTLWYDAAGNTYVQQHRDFQTAGTGVTQGEATERVMYYNAADQLVAVDARIGSAPGWENYLHFLLTFEQYRYDALGRRVFTRSQRLCPSANPGVHQGADFFVECNLGYVQRTVWDGSKELYEVRMPDQSQHWEKDGFVPGDTLGVVNNNAFDKVIDRDAFYGRVGYVYGGAIDKPIVMLRQDYGDRRLDQGTKPYRRFQPFALYPQWDLRGEPSLGTSADGGISRCEMDGTVKRCTYGMAWTQVFAPSGKRIDPLVRGWAGSLLQDKREPNGLLYRRNRYLDPATGRFTQPDPIGLAGGLNAYGYANGDPVSFSDPFGLSPCDDLRKSIAGRLRAFLKDWRKYQHFHAQGLSNAGHEEELLNFQRGLNNDVSAYDEQNCKDDDDHTGFSGTLERSRQFADAPIPKPKQARNRVSGERSESRLNRLLTAPADVTNVGRRQELVTFATIGTLGTAAILAWALAFAW